MRTPFLPARLAPLCALLFLAASTARATDYLWLGSTNTDWFTASNWNPQAVPTSVDSASLTNGNPLINAPGATAQNVLVDARNSTTGITVQGSGTLSVGQVLTLANTDPGNNFVTYASLSVLGGGSVTAAELDMASSTNDVATLLVNGAGSRLSITNGNGQLTLTAGDYGGVANVTVSNGGTLTAGALVYLGRQPTSSGTLTIASGGTVTINGNGVLSMGYSNNYGGSSTLNIGQGSAAGTLNATLINTFASAGEHAQINFNHTDANYTFGIRIAGVASVAQIGSGTTILTNSQNSYTGGTQVSAGTLLVNNASGSGTGSGAVTVNGGTLGGTGTISGAVTVNNGGTLAPGVNTPGRLAVGALTLNTSSTLSVELGGTAPGMGYDQVTVGGQLTLGGNLSVSVASGFALTPGQSFDILVDTGTAPVAGIFANTDAGSLYTDARGDVFLVSYTADSNGGLAGNDVRLTVVPEPATWAAAGMTFATAALFLRRYARPIHPSVRPHRTPMKTNTTFRCPRHPRPARARRRPGPRPLP